MNTKRIHELKAGDIVQAHGGRFRVIADAFECVYAGPQSDRLKRADGPSAVAGAKAVCIEGIVPGYFHPGSEWYFQGNFNAPLQCIEVTS